MSSEVKHGGAKTALIIAIQVDHFYKSFSELKKIFVLFLGWNYIGSGGIAY
jgi:hypothetical protein